MSRYEILLIGTNEREVSFCVLAHNIIFAWDVIEDITSEIAYIGAVYSLNIKEA